MSRMQSLDLQFFDEEGVPLAGGKLTFYEPGTTTLASTYSDSALSVANSNPVILGADGRQPDVFFDGQRKVELRDANDVLIETWDPVGFLSGDLPAGGLTDQALVKLSNDDFDVGWDDVGGAVADPWWDYEGTIRNAAATLVTVDTHYFFEEDGAYTITISGPKSGNDNDRIMVTLVDNITNLTPKITINNVGATEIGFLGYDLAQNGDNACQSVAFIYRNGGWIPYLSHKFTVPV